MKEYKDHNILGLYTYSREDGKLDFMYISTNKTKDFQSITLF